MRVLLPSSTLPHVRKRSRSLVRESLPLAGRSEVALPLLLLHGGRRVVVDHAALALAARGQEHLLDDLGQGGGRALDGAGERIAAERPEADYLHLRHLAWIEAHPLVIDHDEIPLALHHRAGG